MSVRLATIIIILGLIQFACTHSHEIVSDSSLPQGKTYSGGSETDPHKQNLQTEVEEGGRSLLQVEKLLSEGNLHEAIVVLQKEVSRYPEWLRPRLLLGGGLFELGELEQAEKTLISVVEKWHDNSEARLLLGYCLLEKNDTQGAILNFEKVLKLTEEPKQKISAHLGLASIYESIGDQQDADYHYDYVLSNEPELMGIMINIQKELLWIQPVVSKGGEVGHYLPGTTRRANIEAELKKLLKEEKD